MKKLLSAVLLAALMGINGCNTVTPDRAQTAESLDGSAGVVASEFNTMGDASGELLGSAPLSKSEATSDTVYIEKVIQPWHFTSPGCWTRQAEIIFENGNRIRKDTIYFNDSLGQAVDSPSLIRISSYRHVRTVTSSINNFNLHYEMLVTINKSILNTQFTFNGTIEGSYYGDIVRLTTITNVVRIFHLNTIPHLGYPQSGTINIDRPLRTITITYNGGRDVTATTVRKSDNRTTTYIVNVTSGVEKQ